MTEEEMKAAFAVVGDIGQAVEYPSTYDAVTTLEDKFAYSLAFDRLVELAKIGAAVIAIPPGKQLCHDGHNAWCDEECDEEHDGGRWYVYDVYHDSVSCESTTPLAALQAAGLGVE